MESHTLSRPIFWGIAILLGLGILLPAQPLPAQSAGCFAVDMNELPRDCTFLEEHGYCLVNALDSYDACKEGAVGFWQARICELGVQIDIGACNASLPLTLFRSIFST